MSIIHENSHQSTFLDASLNKTSQLNKLDLLYLTQVRHIPENWAIANCQSCDIDRATVMLGYRAYSSGIMFFGDDPYGQWQFRPHTPWKSKDTDKDPPKYRTPIGEYDAFLPKHPEIKAYWTDLEALKARCFTINSEPYLSIGEGCIKAITGCMHGIPTVGLMGVDMGLTPKSKGEPDLVPALKRLAEAGFNFIIAFDSDIKPETIKGVARAEKRLTERLKAYGCDVLSVTGKWPTDEGKGMDDFINNQGIEAFRAILMKAHSVIETPDTGNEKTKKPPSKRETAARLAERHGHYWKYDDEQKTWRVYSGKHWEKVGIGAFTSLVKTTIDAKNINYDGIAYIKDVVELLQCDLRQLKWQFWDKSRYVNFSNCVFDGAEAKTLEHSPGMGFTSFLPYEFKPLVSDLSDALESLRVNCPKFYQFIHTAMRGDIKKMFKLLAIVNAVLKHRFFDLQMFAHFVGAPGSGKGKFARFLQKLVGSANTIACQLDKLGDGSTKASVMDKQLVVFPDERKPVGIDSILSLTGGDAISYRELYQPAASAHFYGSLVICSNKPIFIGDTTGLERRLCLVGFDNPIATEKRDHSLEAELDTEIPACIAIALSLPDIAVTQAIRGVGINQITEFKRKEWEMKVETSSVAAFFDAELVIDPTATIRTGKLYDAYKYFCEEGGFSKVSIVKCPKLLADLLTEENIPFTRHQGAQAYFEGIRLREKSDTHPTHSENLAGVEGVGEGVTGSLQGVGEGVEPSEYKRLRELRQFAAKYLRESANDDDYLLEPEESESEIDLPTSTPSTPSNPLPVTIQTPSPTPSQLPSTTHPTPSNVGANHKTFVEGDRVTITESDNIYQGQVGAITKTRKVTEGTEYTIQLEKESHFVQLVRVTVPTAPHFPVLMKL